MPNSKSIFPWYGGKSNHANNIVPKLRENECYVEVFGGGAGVLWNKPEQYHEIYNDLDGDLVHFFETLREHGDELRDELRSVAPSFGRGLHNKWSDEFYRQGHRPEDDIERATRFFYLRFSTWGGAHSANGFRTGRQRSSAEGYLNAVENLPWFSDRISGVLIENRDYRELIDTYDGEGTLFYLDPPYFERDYYQEGSEFDHEELYDTLTSVDGYVALSYEELPPEWDPLPEGFTVETYTAPYRTPDGTKEAVERVLLNYDPEESPTLDGGLQTGITSFTATN